MVINSPCLTDKKELAILGQMSTSKEFSNLLMAGSLPKTIRNVTPLFNNMLVQNQAPEGEDEAVNQEEGDRVERAITTDASLEAAEDSDNIIKTQTTTIPNVDIPQGIDTGGCLRCQETIGGTSAHTRVTQLENELLTTKVVYNKAFITLTNRVKKLESQLKQKRSSAVIYSLDKKEIDKDTNINLVSKQGEVQETTEHSREDDDETLAETLLNIKRSLAKDKGKGIMQEIELPKKLKKKEMIQLSLDEELAQKFLKKQRLDQQTEETEEEAKAQGNSDQEVEKLKLYMRIIPEEDIAIEATPLAIKPSVIIEYKIVKEGKISTYHITRADGSTRRYTSMINLLENIDREDLETLWKLVKEKYDNTRPEEGFKNLHIFLLVDKVYPFIPATINMMLERKLQADQWNKMCYQLLKLMMKKLRKQ
uniref:Uncharacterized protein n=1 Tax=Tanacetum cinerariifolium TaxID=118510 RepID=A0A699H5R7_TANCI|nr:hypothetical protein [Tanacetum cinerariifolium]